MSATGAAVALDLGTRRVGVAGSDPTGSIASPLRTLDRQHPAFWSELRQLCDGRGCQLLVVGLPLRLDGTDGEAAVSARRFAAQAERLLGVSVVMWDERLTTAQAERALIAQGSRRSRRRELIDAMAAGLLLQSYLDAHRRESAG